MIAYVTNEQRFDPEAGENLAFAGKPIVAKNLRQAQGIAKSRSLPTTVIGYMGPENTRKFIQEMSNEKVD